MIRAFVFIAFLPAVFGQTVDRFEAADVHVSPHSDNNFNLFMRGPQRSEVDSDPSTNSARREIEDFAVSSSSVSQQMVPGFKLAIPSNTAASVASILPVSSSAARYASLSELDILVLAVMGYPTNSGRDPLRSLAHRTMGV